MTAASHWICFRESEI